MSIRRLGIGASAMVLWVALLGVLAFPALAGTPEVPELRVEAVTATTATLQGVLSPNVPGEVGTYEFLYNQGGSCKGAGKVSGVALGGQSEGVSEALSGLSANTEYTVCLIVDNTEGKTAESAPVRFTTALPPETPITEAAKPVATTTAMLHGVLNPGAERTSEPGTDEFRYRQSPTACEGENEKTIAPPATPVGEKHEAVSAEITELLPGTTYTFCLRATNAAGEEALSGPLTFTTLAVAPTVSEEFVTDVSSGSATLHGLVNPGGADTTYRFEYGPTTEYGTSVSGEAGAGAAAVLEVLRTQDLAPDTLYHYRLVAEHKVAEDVAGLDHTFTTQPTGATSALPDGRQWELISPPDKHGAEVENKLIDSGGLMQAAEDGDAVTYITNAPVTASSMSNPLENQVLSRRGPGSWSSQDIATPHAGAGAREFEESTGGFIRTGSLTEYWAFSPDLSLAYAEPEATTRLAPPAPAPKLVDGGGFGDSHYNSGYVRDNFTGTYSITTLNSQEWYDEQVALSEPPPTCDVSTSPVGGTVGQEGVQAVSRDGCYVYFNSEAGAGPLEVAHYDGTQWSTTLISSLLGSGVLSWGSGGSTELSPNGRYLTFMSDQSLTGYDSIDANSPVGEPRADEEVFLYDAATNRLTCPSCDPTGARPVGKFDSSRGQGQPGYLSVDRVALWEGHWLAGLLAPWPRSGVTIGFSSDPRLTHEPHYLTNGGELFFESPLALVSQDVNGTWDVYEYRPQGTGDCSKEAGCVALISSGQSSAESVLIEASTSGSDVFFFTSDRLTGQDIDSVNDVYDAHVCSAEVPCLSPPPPPAPACEGDACQQSVTPPDDPTPASLTYNGPGSLATPAAVAKPRSKARQCKRGFVKTKSKCVKTKAKKSRKTSRRGK